MTYSNINVYNTFHTKEILVFKLIVDLIRQYYYKIRPPRALNNYFDMLTIIIMGARKRKLV